VRSRFLGWGLHQLRLVQLEHRVLEFADQQSIHEQLSPGTDGDGFGRRQRGQAQEQVDGGKQGLFHG
jgi:hypothetical protein